jgi:hypothetical protein
MRLKSAAEFSKLLLSRGAKLNTLFMRGSWSRMADYAFGSNPPHELLRPEG